jgi:hypothetical protein
MRYLSALLVLCVVSSARADEGNGKFKELFNGRDLAGWEADESIWLIEDGLLTGQTTPQSKIPYNTFAIWKDGEVEDFHLIAEFRLEGDNNSGVQYRSKLNPEKGKKYSVIGYQADIHPQANYTGMLYDEGGRGIAAERGQHVTFAADGSKDVKQVDAKPEAADLSKWNKLEVIAQGNRLIHKLNGKETVEVIDNDPKNAEAKGLLALQVHAGPPMKVQYKSVRLKALKAKKDQATNQPAK